MDRYRICGALTPGLLLLQAASASALEPTRSAEPLANENVPLDSVTLDQISALGMDGAIKLPALQSLSDLSPEAAATVLKAALSQMSFQALINGDKSIGERKEHMEFFAQNGSADMLLEKEDEQGNRSHVTQVATVNLLPPAGAHEQTFGAIAQSAAHNFSGGAQSAANFAFGATLRNLRD